MKPAPFEYERATDLASALAALARYGREAKVLAGGQSLIPLLNLRLASAERLIDVGRLDELRYIRLDGNELRVDALTTTTPCCGRPRSRSTARSWSRHIAWSRIIRYETAAPSAATCATTIRPRRCRWWSISLARPWLRPPRAVVHIQPSHDPPAWAAH